MEIAEVRRGLKILRQAWKDNSAASPFFASDVIPEFVYNNRCLSFEEFTVLNETGKLAKRMHKTAKKKKRH